MSISGLVQVVLHRAWLVVLCGVVLAAIAYAVSRQFPYQYTATGEMIVDSRPFAIPELQGAISAQSSADPLPSVRTEAVELHSPELLERVVRQLHLDTSPLFNSTIQHRGLLAPITDWLHTMVPGSVPSEVERENPGVAFAAERLGSLLTVFYDNRSFVINVSAVLPDPKLAADVVNTLLRERIAQRAARRTEENAAANAALTQRLDAERQRIIAINNQLSQLRARTGLINLPAGSSVAQQQMSELSTAAIRATNDRVQAEVLLQKATALMAAGRAIELADVLSSPTIARLRDREATVAGRVAELSSTFGPDYPPRQAAESDLRRAQAAIGEEVGRQVRSLQSAFAAAKDRETAARSALEQARGSASAVSTQQSQIVDLEKEVASRQALYQTLLERASQTIVGLEAANQSSGVHIGSLAVVPLRPTSPHPRMAGLLGGLAGGALGCALALLWGSASRFRDAGEVAALTNVPIISVASTRLLRVDGDGVTPEQMEVLSFLRLRLRQHAVRTGIDTRTIAFAATSGDDSLTLARLFARSAAQAGERILLVDANSSGAKPSTKSQVATNSAPNWRDLVVNGDNPNLSVLPASHGLGDLTDSRNVDRMRNLLREAADDHNFIVVASTNDAMSVQTNYLMELVSYTVLAVNLTAAKRSAIIRRIEHFKTARAPLGLLILSRSRRSLFGLRRRDPVLSNA